MSNAEDRAFELLAIAEKQQLEIQAELAAIQHNNERLKAELTEAVKKASQHSAELTARKVKQEQKKPLRVLIVSDGYIMPMLLEGCFYLCFSSLYFLFYGFHRLMKLRNVEIQPKNMALI